MCAKPFRQGVLEYGCGQCMKCRQNRRRIWVSRLMLELNLHEASCFLTLTYRDEELPHGGSLDPDDLQGFLKRLRDLLDPVRVRFYAVGEYGSHTQRPHYHVALFGFHPHSHCGDKRKVCSCEICRSWGKGGVDVGTLTEQSATYVAGYVTKGMTKKDDIRLNGRYPEFSRMSLRPGLGYGAVRALKEALVDSDGVIHGCDVDVPAVLRSGGKKYPIGRYLRGLLREAMGGDRKEPQLAQAVRQIEAIVKDFPQFDVRSGIARKEGRRLQSGRRARVLEQITSSKKGVGI